MPASCFLPRLFLGAVSAFSVFSIGLSQAAAPTSISSHKLVGATPGALSVDQGVASTPFP